MPLGTLLGGVALSLQGALPPAVGVSLPNAAFLALGVLGHRPAVDRAVVATFSFAQAILFFFWARFFWVG